MADTLDGLYSNAQIAVTCALQHRNQPRAHYPSLRPRFDDVRCVLLPVWMFERPCELICSNYRAVSLKMMAPVSVDDICEGSEVN